MLFLYAATAHHLTSRSPISLLSNQTFETLPLFQAESAMWRRHPITLLQEDSMPTHRGPSLAGLFFTQDKTYQLGPKLSRGDAIKLSPESATFQRLDSLVPREHIDVRPGKLLLAVYNDNW